jgi:prophage regulatory protein
MRFVRTKDVLMMLGVSRTTLWRMVREGRFPRPTLIAKRATGHVLEEVEAWMSARAEANPFGARPLPAATEFARDPPALGALSRVVHPPQSGRLARVERSVDGGDAVKATDS